MNQAKQFHEGQWVEVLVGEVHGYAETRKAKILTVSRPNEPPQTVSVIFTDGTSGVFDVEHIRELKMTKEKEREIMRQIMY